MYVPNKIGIKYREKNSYLITLQSLFILIILYMGYLSYKLKKANSALKEISGIDYLTGIFNRRNFYENFVPKWEEALREKELAHLIIVDLDNFKEINDNYGHTAGDKALKRVAKILKKNLSTGDVGRYGGDEFIGGITGLGSEEGLKMAEGVRRDIENLKISAGNEKVLTVSIGVLSTVPEKPEMREYIKLVDELLYSSKKRGKNRVCHNL